ncbi:MAG TPA: helix-turn-helix transcriptional regulator [Thermomicrobiales bacterium]|nr:helix-turn-helix transcriptional regulator [Thermomicrobiales bacterium]
MTARDRPYTARGGPHAPQTPTNGHGAIPAPPAAQRPSERVATLADLAAELDALARGLARVRAGLWALTPTCAFPTRLRGYRTARRWSQERLAEAADLDHGLISRLEAGKRQPTRRAVAHLAAGLGLDPAERDALFVAAGFLPPSLDPYADTRAGRREEE